MFYQNELSPLFEELSGVLFPSAEEQASIVIGVWSPSWSTIPFKTFWAYTRAVLQIFHENGYYANIGRYAPGHRLSLQDISSRLSAYDLMVIQKYEVQNGNWYIQNVGIEHFQKQRNSQILTKQRIGLLP